MGFLVSPPGKLQVFHCNTSKIPKVPFPSFIEIPPVVELPALSKDPRKNQKNQVLPLDDGIEAEIEDAAELSDLLRTEAVIAHFVIQHDSLYLWERLIAAGRTLRLYGQRFLASLTTIHAWKIGYPRHSRLMRRYCNV